MEWVVTLETMRTLPDESPTDDGAIEEFAELLEPWSGVVGSSPSGWTATLSIDNDGDARDAVVQAVGLTSELAAKAGIGEHRVIIVECVDAAVHDEHLELSNFPDVVGAGEVLEILDISKQRLHQLRTAEQFPLPMLELKSGPIWMRAAIEAFKLSRRPPGRPSLSIPTNLGVDPNRFRQ